MGESLNIPDNLFVKAVRQFWRIREKQSRTQKLEGKSDQGSRSAVTGGKQMDGFARELIELLVSCGLPREAIFTSSKVALPGYFRPTKEWDMIVVLRGRLIAAVELKSHIGPSFGNNFNNRTEEALGSAVDVWTAFREKAFIDSNQPWLGYLLLLEDEIKSREPVRVKEPHFKVFQEFKGSSYAKRYEIFCRRLVLERHYSSACLLFSSKDRIRMTPNYTEPSQDIGVKQFVRGLVKHVTSDLTDP